MTQVFPKASPGFSSYAGECNSLTYDGNTGFDLQRTPTVFKTLSAASINAEATIWTPATGKKFRLMGGLVSIGTAAGAITIRDNTAGTTIAILPKSAVDTPIPFTLPGNGILSTAANNVLTAQGAATSTITGMVWGTEE